MDMTATTTTTTTAAPATVGRGLGLVQPTKSPEAESETPPQIQPTKPISFSNGILKRHAPTTAVYKECLKNHAASLGGHALDGCGEFMPAHTATPSDPTSLKCAACGCHRNFHRRELDDPLAPTTTTHVIEYHPHHRHHPLPPPPAVPPTSARGVAREARSPGSNSPPPISSSYMLLALSSSGGGPVGPDQNPAHNGPNNGPLLSRKRFRTKFTQEQKEKMYEFAEKVGWKMQRSNEEMVSGFCSEIGVERGVFKVWMHNNKNTFGKRPSPSSAAANVITANCATNPAPNDINHHPIVDDHDHDDDDDDEDDDGRHGSSINHQQYDNGKSNNPSTNASSSSS